MAERLKNLLLGVLLLLMCVLLAATFFVGIQGSRGGQRLLLIRHRESGPVSLILLQLRKGGKPGLIWEEQFLFDNNGEPSPFYNLVYHLDEPHA